jgi:hypothetical protein
MSTGKQLAADPISLQLQSRFFFFFGSTFTSTRGR